METSKGKSGRGKRHGNDPVDGFKVALPGRAYRRGKRWWWSVRLPGEDKARARPLKAADARMATTDAREAERIAFEMWEQAVWEQAQRKSRMESSETIERLKAQFLEKVRHFTEIVQNATAKAEAEAQARAEAEAKLQEFTRQPPPRTESSTPPGRDLNNPSPEPACECCGAKAVPAALLHRIDSGQFLCPTCLAALRHDAARAQSNACTDCV